MEYKTVIFNGKRICYTNETVFQIQLGKDKGSYKTQYTIIGDFSTALMYYSGINVGNGYKKRLYVPSFNKPVIHRQFS
jgi:hypothetical protein